MLIALRFRESIPGTHACAPRLIHVRPLAQSDLVGSHSNKQSLCGMEQRDPQMQGELSISRL